MKNVFSSSILATVACNGGGDGGDDGDINNLAVKIKLEANEFNEASAILP